MVIACSSFRPVPLFVPSGNRAFVPDPAGAEMRPRRRARQGLPSRLPCLSAPGVARPRLDRTQARSARGLAGRYAFIGLDALEGAPYCEEAWPGDAAESLLARRDRQHVGVQPLLGGFDQSARSCSLRRRALFLHRGTALLPSASRSLLPSNSALKATSG